MTFKIAVLASNAEDFLKGWQGHLVCDDYSGYKARFRSGQVIEVGCMAHARRKFHELLCDQEKSGR